MNGVARPLLVLDLDEALWHGVPDECAPSGVRFLLRPHVGAFLHEVSAVFDLAVWTAATEDWMRSGLESLRKETGFDLAERAFFLWHRERCTPRRDAEGNYVYRKPARKFRAGWVRSRYPADRILVMDDQVANDACGYGHLVKVTSWTGDPDDDELARLARYLVSIAHEPNFRRLEKRAWRGTRVP